MAAGPSSAGPQPTDNRLVPETHAWLLPGALSEEPRSAHGRGTEGLPRRHPGAGPSREHRARRVPDDQGVRQLGGPRRLPSRLGIAPSSRTESRRQGNGDLLKRAARYSSPSSVCRVVRPGRPDPTWHWHAARRAPCP